MTGATIALLLLLGARPAAADLLKGCEVYGPAFGLDRFVRCKNFTVEVYPPMPAAAEKAILSEQARINSTNPDGREMLTVANVVIGGKTRRAYRYLKKRADGQADVGLVTSVPSGPNAFRLVHCFKGMETGCYDVFHAVMKGLPDSTVPAPPGPPSFGGRPLAVPAGCTRKGPSQLACGTTELTWAPLYPGSPETLDQVDPMVLRATTHLGALTATDRYCLMEKSEALCRVTTITGKKGEKIYLVYGFARTSGGRYWVSCSTRVEPQAAVPSPCDLLMTFKAP
jgi:hypothetical protein